MRSFSEIAKEIGDIVQQKNDAYGNSFIECGKIMRILYPNGISPEQTEEALLVTRIIDKLFRVANIKDAFGESPFKDIAGYGICGTYLSELPKVEYRSGYDIADGAFFKEGVGRIDDRELHIASEMLCTCQLCRNTQ